MFFAAGGEGVMVDRVGSAKGFSLRISDAHRTNARRTPDAIEGDDARVR
jgi:hypothetical protein